MITPMKMHNCKVCGKHFQHRTYRGTRKMCCSKKCGYIYRAEIVRRPFAERFWEKVNKGGPDECWEWTAAKDDDGYGAFGVNGSRDIHKAHRVSWLLQNGIWPIDCLLHKCDNTSCVNPSHLFEGSRSDNMEDKTRKGRQFKTISDDNVRAIRSSSEASSVIAARLGVTYRSVWAIKTGRNGRSIK